MENSFLFDHPGLETGYFYIFIQQTHTHTFITAAAATANCFKLSTNRNHIIRIIEHHALQRAAERLCC